MGHSGSHSKGNGPERKSKKGLRAVVRGRPYCKTTIVSLQGCKVDSPAGRQEPTRVG